MGRSKKPDARRQQVNIRLTEDERQRFARLAEHQGITVAELVRRLINREFAEVATRRPE